MERLTPMKAMERMTRSDVKVGELISEYRNLELQQEKIQNDISGLMGFYCLVGSECLILTEKQDGMKKGIKFMSGGQKYQSWEAVIKGIEVEFYEPISD